MHTKIHSIVSSCYVLVDFSSHVCFVGGKSIQLKLQTADDMAHNFDGKRLCRFDVNVCSEDTELHKSVIESTLQLPDRCSRGTSGVMSESVNFPASTTDSKCIDQ